jgi:hypothetical protein
LIDRTNSDNSQEKRQWNDIFYPENHGYPVNING